MTSTQTGILIFLSAIIIVILIIVFKKSVEKDYNLLLRQYQSLKEDYNLLSQRHESLGKEHRTLSRNNSSLLMKYKPLCKANDNLNKELSEIYVLYPEVKESLRSPINSEKRSLYALDVGERESLLSEAANSSAQSTMEKMCFYKNKIKYLESIIEKSNSNKKIIPYMARIMADYATYPYEQLAQRLDWGNDQKRLKKVEDIREIRREAKEQITTYMEAEYQLSYLRNLYPAIDDIIETDYNELSQNSLPNLKDRDPIRNFISLDEYKSLSNTEKNQLALDRYIESRKKSKWQIGRDYELYVGYLYKHSGYDVAFFGENMGINDLGRDLIVKKNQQTLVIQCKYWSQQKTIHEKHIAQLYGTTACYCMENNLDRSNVKGVFITNIKLSETAKQFADYLEIDVIENQETSDFPRIKCNIGHDEYGETKIYHLPFDQQYDKTIINEQKGECWATTVKEAETAGFRRAYKWHPSDVQ